MTPFGITVGYFRQQLLDVGKDTRLAVTQTPQLSRIKVLV